MNIVKVLDVYCDSFRILSVVFEWLETDLEKILMKKSFSLSCQQIKSHLRSFSFNYPLKSNKSLNSMIGCVECC